MDGLAGNWTTESDTEILAASRERGVIRNLEAEPHDLEDRSKEALGLTQWEIEDHA